MTVLLLGGGGILGSGYRTALGEQQREHHWLRPPWSEPARLRPWLLDALAGLGDAEGPALVLWAAGTGHVGASAAALTAETEALLAVADVVEGLPPARRADVTLVLASSAGALFAGCATDVVHEASVPEPVSAYGAEKLRQEAALRRLADRTGCRVLSLRLSNLFGLASGHVTQRGLVSSAVRSARLRQPLTVFVSPDTRRDYLYNEDAARWALRLAEVARPGFTTALLCEGSTRSVAQVLSTVARVSRRRVPVTYAERPETRHQPRTLSFVRPSAGPRHPTTPFDVALNRMVLAPLLR